MKNNEISVSESIKNILCYMIEMYNENHGELSLDRKNKFVKNELGFRIHKSNIAPLIENSKLSELNNVFIFSDNVRYIIEYDPLTLWFTISENKKHIKFNVFQRCD
jgi:hypothetical protein